MRVDVLGLGPTAQLWKPGNYTIGVNDCCRFGPVQRLIVVNSFWSEPIREKVIRQSNPEDGLWSHLKEWSDHPRYKFLEMRHYFNRVTPGTVYSSHYSSTFIAMTMAVAMGAKQVVLYGVDFDNHKVIRGSALDTEVGKYKLYSETVGAKGVFIYLASDSGALKNVLPCFVR